MSETPSESIDRANALAQVVLQVSQDHVNQHKLTPREFMSGMNFAHAKILALVKPGKAPLKEYRLNAGKMLASSIAMLVKEAQQERQTSAVIQPPVADVPQAKPKRRWWPFGALFLAALAVACKLGATAQACIFGM